MEWKFATDHGDLDNVGFKDNDIEKFGQDPAKSIVREAIQNSCDALDIESNQTQVKVVIKKGVINKKELPNFSSIEHHIRACLKESNDPAENKEIERHISSFETEYYTYLEISDYNTTGMDLKSFEGLTQGIFKSVKKISGSQGSKGVGKAAYYSSSYLRTMLIVTKSNEGVRYRGASKIANHIHPQNGKKLNYKGFYGDLEVKKENEIPSLFRRNEKGTSIFVIGLWPIENLESDIIKEILRNYWFAILRNQLVVNINDTRVDRNNVKSLVEMYFSDLKDYKSGDKQNPRPYLETVEYGKEFKRSISHIGECSLWLHQNDSFNLGAVARFRKTKMLIYKEKDLDSGFAGVFLCDNTLGNAFLKEIENDAHDSWNERINHSYKEMAGVTLREIKEFIRESYSEFSGINNRDSFTIDLLDDLFNFAGTSARADRKSPKPKPEPKPSDEIKERILESAKFKSFSEKGELYYRLEIISKIAKKNHKFKVSIGTDSSRDFLSVLTSSSGTFDGNILKLDIQKGLNVIHKIQLDSPFLVAPIIFSVND